MIFPAHAWFSTGKINVKLACTYRGRTKIYFLKWGRRTKKFEKPWSSQGNSDDPQIQLILFCILFLATITFMAAIFTTLSYATPDLLVVDAK